MTDTPLLAALRQSADPKAVDRIEHLVEHGADRDLNRINALAFAAKHNPRSTKDDCCVSPCSPARKSVDRDRYHLRLLRRRYDR
jgi:hypothetical protein